MFFSALVLAATTLCGVVSAQNYSTSGPISITPDSVSESMRNTWCINQRQNCPLVCGGQAFPNNCSNTDLSYTCTCTDGSHPNISSYANMIPSLECIQWVKDCVAAAGNNLQQLTNCRSVTCGSKDPGKVPQNTPNGGGAPASSSSAAASSSTGSSASQTSSGSSAATSSGAAVALGVARDYGTGIMAAGMLAVFGLAL